jgi:hypothetical protein
VITLLAGFREAVPPALSALGWKYKKVQDYSLGSAARNFGVLGAKGRQPVSNVCKGPMFGCKEEPYV